MPAILACKDQASISAHTSNKKRDSALAGIDIPAIFVNCLLVSHAFGSDISDVHVATFGSNTAVAHYKFTYDAEINGTHRARSVICSDTWVNDSGAWRSAATP